VLGGLRDRLTAELEVSPSAETLALEQSLRRPAEPRAVSASALPEVVPSLASPTPAEPSAGPTATAATRSPGRWRAGVAVGAIVMAGAALFAMRREPAQATPAPTGPRVVVEPFSNQTGDSTLASVGSMVADWITEGVSRLDGVSVVPLSALTAVRGGAGARAPAITPSGLSPAAVAMARELGATVLVSGAAYRTGATLHLQARVHDVASGALRHPPEIVSVPVDSIMTGIDRLRSRVVGMLAPLADTVSHLRRAIAPPSYEVYRDYVAGLERFVRGDLRTALALFERAAQVDTAYPMPRIAAVMALANLGAFDSAARMVAGLQTSRVRLGPLERATLDMADGLLRGDLAQVEAASQVQGRIAPGTIGDYMVGESARRRGAPRKAVAHLRTLDPERGELRGWSAYWHELTGSLHMLGAYDDEERAARQAVALYPDQWDIRADLVRALAANGRPHAADSALGTWPTRTARDSVALADMRYVGWTTLSARGDTAAAARWRVAEGAVLAELKGDVRRPGVRWRHARQLLLNGAAMAARDSLQALRAGQTMDVRTAGLLGAVAARLRDRALLADATAELARADAARSATVRAMEGQDAEWWRAVIAAQRGDAAAVASLLTAVYAAGRSRDITLADDPFFAGIRRDAAFARLVSYAK
jgi:TolB-like protein